MTSFGCVLGSAAAAVWVQLTDEDSKTARTLERVLGRLPTGSVAGLYGLLFVANCALHELSPGRLPAGNEKHHEQALAAEVLTDETAGERRPPPPPALAFLPRLMA